MTDKKQDSEPPNKFERDSAKLLNAGKVRAGLVRAGPFPGLEPQTPSDIPCFGP